MVSGNRVFKSTSGVQYLIDRYLTSSDIDDLRKMNNPYSSDKFERELTKRLEKRSGGGKWIPDKYTDELANNASSIIGTTRTSGKLKNGRSVDVWETKSGENIYEDDKGFLHDFKTGRFSSRKRFE